MKTWDDPRARADEIAARILASPRIRAYIAQAQEDARRARQALADYDQNGGISLEELSEELGLREPQR